MQRSHVLLKTGGLLFASFLLWGCGGQPSTAAGGSSSYTFGSSSSGSPSPSPSQTPGSSGTGVAPFVYQVSGVGYDSTTISVQTRTILDVQFTPGVQNQPIKGTGYYPEYSKLGVYIGVGTSNLAPTEMLTNGYDGTSVETSHIFNLSSQFTPVCQPNDTTCSQTVVITIAKPNNDYFCLNEGEYCPWAKVYAGHPWNGTLTVQTDDTNALQ